MSVPLTAALQMGIAACQAGGRVVLVGMGQDDMKLPMTAASTSEIDIYGSFRYVNTVRRQARPGRMSFDPRVRPP